MDVTTPNAVPYAFSLIQSGTQGQITGANIANDNPLID